MNSRYGWAALVGLGAGLMFLLDPQSGNRRRALLRDRLRRVSREGAERASALSEMAADHAKGFVAETTARLRQEEVDDRTLVERVRAELGRAVTNAGAVIVEARGGVVTLRGNVLQREGDAAIAAARATRGVRSVADALTRSTEAGNVPSLQGSTADSRDR